MEIVTLSIGRNILKSGSHDRTRMTLYAKHLNALHIIILSRYEHEYADDIHEGNLHLYPTNSRSRFTMVIDAGRIAYRILKTRTATECTLTAQDPLELGLLSYLLSRSTKVPYTVQVHGDYYSPEWSEGSVIRKMRRRIIPFVLRHASKVRVVSERIRRSLEAIGISDSTMGVLPVRPVLELFLRATRTRPEGSPFVVLTASRFATEKNIPFLIRAFKTLHERHPDTVLRITGSGNERERIEAAITSCGLKKVVTILPWTEHIEIEMANADVFALASLHESYGLVLIEALASGTPVVTTDVGCVGEVIQDGVHGHVIAVNDTEVYEKALIDMYEDVEFRKRAGQAGRKLALRLATQNEEEYAKKWVALHSASAHAVY